MDLAINIIKNSSIPIPDEIQKMTGHMLVQSDQSLVVFLDKLKQVHDILSFGQSKLKQNHVQPAMAKAFQDTNDSNLQSKDG